VLASRGSINALMRGDVRAIVAAGGAPVVSRLVDEVAAIMTAAGFPPGPGVVEGDRALLTDPEAQGTSSMYRDLVAGYPIEAEHIVGDLVARGRSLGVAAPLLEATLVNLRVYENSR
jgi:2-dehydropantoate 2-reductase